MSQSFTPQIPPARAADLTPEWIAGVRAAIQRDGHAVRGGFPDITIEIQTINQPETWYRLNLQTNTGLFATEQDRDTILDQLVGKSRS
jgi:hypothetical protein